MTEIQKAMHWLLNGNTGLSSECMMATLLSGQPVEGNYKASFHPSDPADFERCVGLLNAVPTFRVTLDVMKQVSKQWAILVEHWDDLENLLNQEISQRSAPKTYARMKELFASVESSECLKN